MATLEAREKAMTALDEKRQMQSDFQTQLAAAIPELQIVGQDAPRLWNTISVIMPEVDCRQRWVVKMDRFGFAVSTGSACSSGLEAPSHVLQAMGYSSEECSRALRFSAGWETTAHDWATLLQGLLKARQAFMSAQA